MLEKDKLITALKALENGLEATLYNRELTLTEDEKKGLFYDLNWVWMAHSNLKRHLETIKNLTGYCQSTINDINRQITNEDYNFSTAGVMTNAMQLNTAIGEFDSCCEQIQMTLQSFFIFPGEKQPKVEATVSKKSRR